MAGTVNDFCGMDGELMLFCGVAIGHPDADAPVNRPAQRARTARSVG